MTLFRSGVMVVALLTAGLAMRAAEGPVLHDLAAGKALAAKEGKQLVIEFSGRTWCPPCKLLVKEVLPSEAFAAFAADRVIVHLDYPRRSERTPEKIAADPALAKLMAHRDEYKIEGFPTVVLLDAGGKELGRVLGYESGMGAAMFIAELTGGKGE
jgi:thioredoxin-related protein